MEVKDMAYYVHHVPGRLRVKTLALKKNIAQAQQLQLHLEGMDGVLEAEANIVTGSIVIKYDACLVSSATILNKLRDEGYIHNTDAAHQSGHQIQPAQKLTDTFVTKLIETAVERSAVALIAALI